MDFALYVKICEIIRVLSKAGPIPGDCDYSELRTAFLSHGQTCHLFIQNNQVKILTTFDADYNVCSRLGLKGIRRSLGPDRLLYRTFDYWHLYQFCPQVKFGYVVFTEAETAERLFRQGGVVVRRASGERIQVRLWRS